MNRTHAGRLGGLCLLLGLTLPLRAQAQSSVSADTSWLASIALNARTRANQLAAGQRPDARAEAQYNEAIAELERGAWSDASITLQAALQRARTNARYRGDLAYALARTGNWTDAHASWVQAYQAMNQNPWFLVGAAYAKAQQRSWADAAGTIQLAVQADSAIIDARLASEAATWFQQAGDGTQALQWARLAVAKDSTDGRSWLRIAAGLNARNDSGPESARAIHKAVTLLPNDRLANGLYAGWLYQNNRIDSALARAAIAAQDSSYQSFAANLHFEAARQALRRRDVAKARAALTTGRQWATPEQRPGYAYLMGRVELLHASTILAAIETTPNCDSARLVDTVLASAQRNLTEGASFDTTGAPMFLTQVLPNYRTQATNAVQSSCQAAPAPRPRPAPRRRP